MRKIFKCLVITLILSVCMAAISFTQDQFEYPETIIVLREVYEGEVTACQTYSAFAQRASEEKHPSLARLFSALETSETIHANNFKKNLQNLGVAMKEIPKLEIKVSNTKKNLKYALNVELAEIDSSYPEFIKRIRPEGYEEAINDITYAWKSEKQHRDLLKQTRSAIRFFFGKVAKQLKQAEKYFVCQRCGSTLSELPKEVCPICSSPASLYKEVE